MDGAAEHRTRPRRRRLRPSIPKLQRAVRDDREDARLPTFKQKPARRRCERVSDESDRRAVPIRWIQLSERAASRRCR